ncbi:uridine kinase [Propionicicella superfundia]|uniref:uridine kinase n=1 Tax=Propionicicella superfundia TaxID=348582 RepID=UPI000401AF81|nr:uridine kinase [Propionicicella superfundia]
MTRAAIAILLAGPSGSGKSRLARLCRLPLLRLDDFYRDGDHPDLPRRHGIVDWDDPASWDREACLTALATLCATGRAQVPAYDIASSARIGCHDLDLGAAPAFVAEGIFAPTLLADARKAGVPVEAIYLDRPRTLVAILRLVRDLRTHRKPPAVLLRRGFTLWREQPALKRDAVAAGFRPLSMRAAQRRIGAMAGDPGRRADTVP